MTTKEPYDVMHHACMGQDQVIKDDRNDLSIFQHHPQDSCLVYILLISEIAYFSYSRFGSTVK